MKRNEQEWMELTIFQVADVSCAMDILNIKEIIKHLEITRVHNAPPYIRGVASLRGEIITVVDVREKFGFDPIPLNEDMRIIVTSYRGENTGLLVDRVLDVHMVDVDAMEPLASNINGINRDFFSGIYKMESGLAAVLNTEALLQGDSKLNEHVR
ncbi:MAG TPA: purine-binding chemotaxis protein CheW [Caldithrix abyssi]|uniref:Purine-binding chemotaxis protein CheW n=1 Tax=Caldithrix abyssi TaxID=187145 RepID=A0A7V1PTJ7_CALAY|nr:purine-binding chemotaxis protein CheW [Caldithrix abyssi]